MGPVGAGIGVPSQLCRHAPNPGQRLGAVISHWGGCFSFFVNQLVCGEGLYHQHAMKLTKAPSLCRPGQQAGQTPFVRSMAQILPPLKDNDLNKAFSSQTHAALQRVVAGLPREAGGVLVATSYIFLLVCFHIWKTCSLSNDCRGRSGRGVSFTKKINRSQRKPRAHTPGPAEGQPHLCSDLTSARTQV